MIQKLILGLIICLMLPSCVGDHVALPKPRIYPKVIYPEKGYEAFQNPECSFSMEIPRYFQYIKDSLRTAEELKEKCWFDLYTPELNTYIHMSYRSFDDRAAFDDLVADAFEMADKHNVKASYRDELLISDPQRNVHGLIFEIDGPVATPMQFFLTDSTQHFVRGSLYFKAQVNRDSIAPVYAFLKEDMKHLLQTFEWK